MVLVRFSTAGRNGGASSQRHKLQVKFQGWKEHARQSGGGVSVDLVQCHGLLAFMAMCPEQESVLLDSRTPAIPAPAAGRGSCMFNVQAS